MSTAITCYANIKGLNYPSNIRAFSVRSGPGVNFSRLFMATVGTNNLPVLEVQRDAQNEASSGKIHQWFKLVFPDGRIGWVRDHVLEVYGQCGMFGYDNVTRPTFAFAVRRDESRSASLPAPAIPNAPSPEETPPLPAPAPQPPPNDDLNRVQRASYAITAAFEGGGYGAYNNYDRGIVSYGIMQFTLASGSLTKVLEKFVAGSQTRIARALKDYLPRLQSADATLRNDNRFRLLLIDAARDEMMRQAQDEVATAQYWDVVQANYVTPRQLKLPLSFAFLFDMGINFGTAHGFVRQAERALGVPFRSIPGRNGITEQRLIQKVAELRRTSHYNQAARENLPGLRVRGDFWVNLMRRGDWYLQGDERGNVNVNGRLVQVKEPL